MKCSLRGRSRRSFETRFSIDRSFSSRVFKSSGLQVFKSKSRSQISFFDRLFSSQVFKSKSRRPFFVRNSFFDRFSIDRPFSSRVFKSSSQRVGHKSRSSIDCFQVKFSSQKVVGRFLCSRRSFHLFTLILWETAFFTFFAWVHIEGTVCNVMQVL